MYCLNSTYGGRALSRRGVVLMMVIGVALVLAQTSHLAANPVGGTVVAGAATIGGAGATLNINQSTQSAIINWRGFSIAGGQTTKFLVPNSAAATLNRVTGGNPSSIYGALRSNGVLYLVNPNGIVVGPSGTINTAGFVASTLDVSNEQFLAGGDLAFSGTASGQIDNQGTIRAAGADVYLIAPQISNEGTIHAPQGTAGLAAGTAVLLQRAGDEHLFVQPSSVGTARGKGVTNAGTIRAATVELKAAGGNPYALAINNTGAIAATGYKKINGQVYLTALSGSIANSGRISATNRNGSGGRIAVQALGSTTATAGTITNSGTLNASAAAAGQTGGTVLVRSVAGRVVNTASGAILAPPGVGGKGGTIETSGTSVSLAGTIEAGKGGRWLIDPNDIVIDSAAAATIDNALNAGTGVTEQTTAGGTGGTGEIDVDAELAWTGSATLTLDAYGNLKINAPISIAGGELILNYSTGGSGDLTVAAPVTFQTSEGAALEINNSFYIVEFDLDTLARDVASNPSGNFALGTDVNLSESNPYTGAVVGALFSGTFEGLGHSITSLVIDDPTNGNDGLFATLQSGGTIRDLSLLDEQVTSDASNIGGVVGVANGGEVLNCSTDGSLTETGPGLFDLGGIVGQNGGASIIGCSSSAAVEGDAGVGGIVGFSGVETQITSCQFSGTVTGSNSVGGIVGRMDEDGTISNCTTTGTVNGSGLGGDQDIGGVAGQLDSGDHVTTCTASGSLQEAGSATAVGGLIGSITDGMVSGCTTSNQVDCTAGNITQVGGLVGISTGGSEIDVGNSSSPITVTDTDSTVGGLVGLNQDSTIVLSTASGAVTGGFSDIGGLVGNNNDDALIEFSHATGHVTEGQEVGPNPGAVGGLVGDNDGSFASVQSCYATGSVSGITEVGGLVGDDNDGLVTGSYATGAVTGRSGALDVGGLVGNNTINSSVQGSYATGPVMSAGASTGGLVGANQTESTVETSFSLGAVTGTMNVGGLVGVNSGSIQTSYEAGAVSGTQHVGGLLGDEISNGALATSYWATDAGGQNATLATVGANDETGTVDSFSSGKTLAQLRQQSTYDPSWDFVNTWTTDNGSLTPQLIGLPVAGTPVAAGGQPGGTTVNVSGPSSNTGEQSGSASQSSDPAAQSNIVPPVLVPQADQVSSDMATAQTKPNEPSGLINYLGLAAVGLLSGDEADLASASSNGGLIGADDAAEINGAGLGNVLDADASNALELALSAAVRQNLIKALKASGNYVDEGSAGTDLAVTNDGQETIISSGDAVVISGQSIKVIPIGQAPPVLQKALGGDVLNNVKHGGP